MADTRVQVMVNGRWPLWLPRDEGPEWTRIDSPESWHEWASRYVK